MAAGLGFKDFITGEVLTAADVDGYLMQGVWVFASAAARDAAVTSPQEGNFAYLKDTNVTTYYTGSAWANLDTTGMTNPMTTTGDTIYSSSGSTPARLGIGTTGQVLTVSGGIPSWATPAGGGGMTLLQTLTLTGSSTTSSSLSSSYKNLIVQIENLYVAADEPNLTIRFNSDTGSNYTYQNIGMIDAVVSGRNDATTNTSIEILNRTPNVSTQIRLGFGQINIRNYTNTSAVGLSYTFTGSNSAGKACALFGTGVYDGSAAISTITFTPASSTFSGGTALIYGVN